MWAADHPRHRPSRMVVLAERCRHRLGVDRDRPPRAGRQSRRRRVPGWRRHHRDAGPPDAPRSRLAATARARRELPNLRSRAPGTPTASRMTTSTVPIDAVEPGFVLWSGIARSSRSTAGSRAASLWSTSPRSPGSPSRRELEPGDEVCSGVRTPGDPSRCEPRGLRPRASRRHSAPGRAR